MDTEREREHLAQANRHIAEARVRIDRLKESISLAKQQGHSISSSMKTLSLFESRLRLMMILRELRKTEPLPC